jgi:hypothetical protein
MSDSIEQLSFRLTADALAEQERALSGLRVCAGTVLGAASVAGSFLGGRAVHGSLDTWSVLALISFTVCVGSAVWVMGPHHLAFAFRGRMILAAGDSQPAQDLQDAYRAADSWMDAQMHTNVRVIADLSAWLSLSCLALATEVVLWTIGVIV